MKRFPKFFLALLVLTMFVSLFSTVSFAASDLKEVRLNGTQLQVGHYTDASLTGNFVLNSANNDIAKETKNLVNNSNKAPYFWSKAYNLNQLKDYGGSTVPAILIDVANGGEGVAICGYEMYLREALDCVPLHFEFQVTTAANSDAWVKVFEDAEPSWNGAEYHREFDEVTAYKVRILFYDIDLADTAFDDGHYKNLTAEQTRFSLAEINLLEKINSGTNTPTEAPTKAPTRPVFTTPPTQAPTAAPTEAPTAAPTEAPTAAPTEAPTAAPTEAPTAAPTEAPTVAPTEAPTVAPTEAPTVAPTEAPTVAPTEAPTVAPTEAPTVAPTEAPTEAPTQIATTPVTEPIVIATEPTQNETVPTEMVTEPEATEEVTVAPTAPTEEMATEPATEPEATEPEDTESTSNVGGADKPDNTAIIIIVAAIVVVAALIGTLVFFIIKKKRA